MCVRVNPVFLISKRPPLPFPFTASDGVNEPTAVAATELVAQIVAADYPTRVQDLTLVVGALLDTKCVLGRMQIRMLAAGWCHLVPFVCVGRCTGALSSDRVFEALTTATAFAAEHLANAVSGISGAVSVPVLSPASPAGPTAAPAVASPAAHFSSLLGLCERLLNRHCQYFRLHGINTITAGPASGAGGAAAPAAGEAPWRAALLQGDSVDYFHEKSGAWLQAWVTTALANSGQLLIAFTLNALAAAPQTCWIARCERGRKCARV
jgi:hypothetical protein